MSHGQNVTVDITIGSKCHCGRSELGRNVQAAICLCPKPSPAMAAMFFASHRIGDRHVGRNAVPGVLRILFVHHLLE